MVWWWKGRRRAPWSLYLLVLAAGSLSLPLLARAAQGAAPLPSAVEDYAYPAADKALADLGIDTTRIKVKNGDGHLTVVDCGRGLDVTDDRIKLRTTEQEPLICFRVDGPDGYLAVEIPNTYSIESDAHPLDATLRRISDGKVSTKALTADDGTCVAQAPGCWNQVGATDPDYANASDLLELTARPPKGSGIRVLPVPPSDPSVGRLTVGAPGRSGSRGCSATLVAPSWVVTAASCFGDPAQLSAGAPPTAAAVAFGGQVPRPVVRVVARSDRDVALAKLEVPVDGVATSRLAGSAPATGLALQAKGLGRTASDWVPDVPHTTAASVSGVSGASLALSGSGPICKGDAGGPLTNAAGEVVGVVTGSGQQGCRGATGAVDGARGDRVDDLGEWVASETRFGTGYLVNAAAGRCLDLSGYGQTDGTRLQAWDCLGAWNQKLALSSDDTVRNPQTGKCVAVDGANPTNGAAVVLWSCQDAAGQKWKLQADGSMRNPQSGRCLDIDSSSGGTPNGAVARLWDCNGQPNQRWALRTSDGELRNPMSGKCIESKAYGTANGSPIGVWSCVGGWNQRWVSAPDGTLRNALTGTCIQYDGANPNNGSKLVLGDCRTPATSLWARQDDGSLRNPASGRCLDIDAPSGTVANGSATQLWDCTGQWNQKWTTRWIDGRAINPTLEPIGTLDLAAAGPATVRFYGWALDPETDAPVHVHLYVDNNLVADVAADQARGDVGAAYPPYGARHGYDTTLPAAAGSHDLCAYAINRYTGTNNSTLGCRKVTVGEGAPIGSFDRATGLAGSVSVYGWALDYDTAKPIRVHVYVDNVAVREIVADRRRDDVGSLFPGYGPNHGFDATVPAAPGAHTVCTYAINEGAAVPNTTLGCATVTVS